MLVCFACQFFLPWWSMAIAAFLLGYFFNNKKGQSFFAGLLGVGILWFAMAYYIDTATDSILTEKMNKLLPLNTFLLTTIIGGLVGGLATLSGSLFNKRKTSKYY
ncbi:MAG: hypothetical protein JST48_02885 [Bacteroidetes bacterium]|nr:hypothetical protein [Bacteroidota bacterium]